MTDALPVAAASVVPVYLGIDIAKAKLDLARSDSTTVATFVNDSAGIAALLASLKDVAAAAAIACIVIEATGGGLERPLLEALLEAQLPVALVNPGQVRSFARGIGKLAKTDAIDARSC